MTQIYDGRQDVAFAGMKADSRFDTVETFAAETDIPFGVVVTIGTKPTQAKLGGAKAVGIALHTHTKAIGVDYAQYDAVSVLTRGVAWCKVKGEEAVTERGAVQFDAATGEVSDSAGTALTNAIFRSGVVTLKDKTKIALVELHAPQI